MADPDLQRETILEAVLEAVRQWAAAQDQQVAQQLVEQAAMTVRCAAGYPPGCFQGEQIFDEPEPEGVEVYDLAYQVPSLNVMLSTHFRTRAKQRDQLVEQLIAQMGKKRIAKLIPRRVHYVCYRRRRITDIDNLFASTKTLTDCLKRVGLIYDDTREWCTPSWQQELAGQCLPHTEVHIWDQPEACWSDAQRRVVERFNA